YRNSLILCNQRMLVFSGKIRSFLNPLLSLPQQVHFVNQSKVKTDSHFLNHSPIQPFTNQPFAGFYVL
ncbi:MAG: hypothetical protein KJ063_12965, partial [Anaerolineae bacterium]|nr:hypothetical protein [Anaerolineae bacterium]